MHPNICRWYGSFQRIGFEGKDKIQDHWEKTTYQVEGQTFAWLPVLRIVSVEEEGKVKVVNWNLLLPFGDNVEDSENEESQQNVDGPSDWIQAVSDDVEAEAIKLCQQILNPRAKVMLSMYSVYKLYISHVIGLTPCGDGQKYLFWHQKYEIIT